MPDKPPIPTKGKWVKCFFDCNVCGQKRVQFFAPARDPEKQDAEQWMRVTAMVAAARAHTLGNLLCVSKHLDLGFKMPKGVDHIGQATVIDGVEQPEMTPEEVAKMAAMLAKQEDE